MPIWLVRGTLLSERCSFGKTGWARASCQYALICRAMKPKLRVCKDTQSCGGA